MTALLKTTLQFLSHIGLHYLNFDSLLLSRPNNYLGKSYFPTIKAKAFQLHTQQAKIFTIQSGLWILKSTGQGQFLQAIGLLDGTFDQP